MCREWQGTPQGQEGQRVQWVSQDDLDNFAMPEADIPLVPVIKQAMRAAQ